MPKTPSMALVNPSMGLLTSNLGLFMPNLAWCYAKLGVPDDNFDVLDAKLGVN